MEEIHFTITVDHQPVKVRVRPHYHPNFLAHFEFRSPCEPARQIPMSRTGYTSQFVYRSDMRDVDDIEAFALELAQALTAEANYTKPQKRQRDAAQGSLF
jgi:hypothetical protein